LALVLCGSVAAQLRAVMEKPIIFYVDDEPNFLNAIRDELSRRYAADYEVLGEGSPVSALQIWPV
jgi:hypothetical protein